MKAKLKLTIKKDIIKVVKKYAKKKGQNLSKIVKNYFKLITLNRRPIKPNQLPPRTRRLRGIIKAKSENKLVVLS